MKKKKGSRTMHDQNNILNFLTEDELIVLGKGLEASEEVEEEQAFSDKERERDYEKTFLSDKN